jgi:TonB family protein
MSWSNQGTSIRMDVVSLLVALALHAPLTIMKFDTQKKAIDVPANRLVAIDIIDPEVPKPIPAPPPPIAKENSFMAKLKALVKKEPPPPPPPVKKEPQKLAEGPKPIALQPKLELPEKLAPPLQTKSGFSTTASQKLIDDKKLAMQSGIPGIAPLSAKKLGTIDDRAAVKADKGKFQIAKGEAISSIGGDVAGLSAGNAPTIALATGRKASVERFSAPITQKSDKGRLGNAPEASLAGGPNLGLRDSVIARDAAPSQINTAGRGGVSGGMPGGVPGGVGTKKDAGSFQGGVPGGVWGGTGSQGSGVRAAPKVAEIIPKKKQQQSMFVITGPLSNRKIERQVLPEYPAWAQAQGIEASVVLEFTVEPSGIVKYSIVVRRTSGYPKLDESAIKALRQWKFMALTGDENREEVGQITFNYSLS